MQKLYSNGKQLHAGLSEGVNILADNVAATYGPSGKNVILHAAKSNPLITKDGVTVARFVELEDKLQNTAAQILKQAAIETNNIAGDGTTTSIVLARALYIQAERYLLAGVHPVELKRGIDLCLKHVVEKLELSAKKISKLEDIEHVATISANGDKNIGKLLATAIDKVGRDGAIKLEESRTTETILDVVEGFKIPTGYVAQSFVTDKKQNVVSYNNALVLVSEYKIENVAEILPILELIARDGRPFVIISDDVSGQALAALIMNSVRGTMKVAAVKPPDYGVERRKILEDLCIAIGATFITNDSGIRLEEVTLKHLGSCKEIEIQKNQTTIVAGNSDCELVSDRIDALQAELKQTEGLEDCEKIQERINRLSSGVAVIKIGGTTEVEMIEKKHRIEDALNSIKSALEEGILPGGGVSLYRLSETIDIEGETEDQQIGVDLLRSVLKVPLEQIAKNAGVSYQLIANEIFNFEDSYGYDFKSCEYVDMFEAGIVDPLKVVRTALQNAVSVASILMTASHAIIEKGE